MRIGDLVMFQSSNRLWQWDYKDRNPGVVLRVTRDGRSQTCSAHILWCNGEQTTEHETFLAAAISNA